ncbi:MULTISPECIES: helix-turn-helix domain-containing protein [unclassified Pseudoclavibacter]|uniref:helix-turn-helix domain-containing protein n=1 Tax=unclassified Pseudoclavibacter TaxID=2615177 RepID=UPI0012F00A2F|nr:MULTISPECIES: helix-turn-helix transcriptional regulator [unclassified Pseudoclavibacter]MBF4457743.1 helix-turn-helix transcriptional regulator [Pseudoclavibacter sp. VKM Ac-2867]VXB61127.1 XRE family transcriptional regulator [Pseudoclavibacter sp. 8L]
MVGELQRSVGKNIRRIRLSRGISQEALGDVVGLHRTYIGSVERGERNITLQTLEGMAELLGVPPMELLADAADAGPTATPVA